MRLTILPFPLLSLLLLLPPPPSSLSLIPSHASPSPAPTSPPVNSTSCASYMCGSINISYPFYLSEALTIPSQYCGYPGMGVFCDHERTPILLTQNGNYTITHINYTNRIISLADTDVLNTPNVPCHRVRHNFTFFSNSTLNYTLSDTNLTFVFNCSLDTDPLFMVPCFSKKPLYSYVFPQDGPPKDYFKLVNRCEEAVVVPVLRKNLIPISPNALPTFYGPLLKDGFQLTWNNLENDYCNRCDKSGGRCGFNQTNGTNWGSACFYQDGMHSGDRGDSSSANGGDTIGPSGANIPGITNSKSGTGRKKQHFVIAIAAVPTIFIIFMFFCLLWCRRRRKGNKNFLSEQSLANNLWESEERGSESLVFDFFQIANATNNFSAKNKLGQGGFGPVYKGQLPDGQEIAVKRLARNSGQGLVEFKNEILVIAKLQHINLVKLLGYSVRGEEKILIYEFMPNKSLDFFIFDQTQGALLDWPKRFHIIEGVAQGLLYLHKHSRLKIIHRDLKASNILLDGFMNPKISDFGLARIFSSNEDQGNFTSKVAGTLGYISPEYAADGRFSIKSDVFSFGVLLLEIVSGKRNAGLHPYAYGDFHNLLGYAWEMWKEGRGLELVDPLLGIEYSMDQVMKCIHVALLCVQEKPSDRPTMSVVTTMLSPEGSTALADPMQPGFFNLGGRNEADEPSDVDEIYSLNRVSVTDPMVR